MSENDGSLPGNNHALRLLYKQLQTENIRLKQLLTSHGILYESDQESQQEEPPHPSTDQQSVSENHSSAGVNKLTKQSPLSERVSLFISYFCGRKDVYARQWRGKDGKIGYSPACKNEWIQGVCRKPKLKCADCSNSVYLPYDETAITDHLSGKCMIGVYPLLPDDTCGFLVIDFDEADWKADIRAMTATCANRNIPYAVEISRSGNGAHFWLFFQETIEASTARNFGSLLLSQTMQENARLQFSSYDRMFPNQDTMPKGGFGNLIALPFQKEAYKHGGCIFVDETLTPYPDQWTFLSSVHRISHLQIEAWMAKEHTSPLGELRHEEIEENPWMRNRAAPALSFNMPSTISCVEADRLYVPVDGLSQKAQNHIKRLAAFRNPAFYKAQAMRLPVWNKPRIICCAEYVDRYLCLPRGCKDAFCSLAAQSGTSVHWKDARCAGRTIEVDFHGSLREEQLLALDALIREENGVLSATTAFGKTVIAAALIAQKRVNTLILVHRTQLMQQWKERLSEFLVIRETLPDAQKHRGRKKHRDVIGIFGGGKDTRGGIIDIGIFQSMGSADEIKLWIGEYGMVIVDECHHVPAVSFENVIKAVKAKYIYGLTATPARQDGHHPILSMYLGPIRYQVDAKAQAKKRPFSHIMIPRFTGTRFHINAEEHMPIISQYYAQIILDDLRNHLITDDVLSCIKEGRNCLLLTERTKHVKVLAELLDKHIDGVITLTGGKTSKETAAQIDALRNAPLNRPLVICATGKYIGEGFDEPRLDTLFLTMPISWHGTLAQYAGRLHRLHVGKREVRVYDYIDSSEEMLERMYQKRLKGYASIGYQVSPDACDASVSGDIIYNQITFQRCFIDDISQARSSIVIVSPYTTLRRVNWLKNILTVAQSRGVSVTVYTRPAESFLDKNRQAAESAIHVLVETGITMQAREGIHQKFAVIDERIVWYGSVNLLSFSASQESIMRLVSGSVAKALRME